jgi:hypothetical protein
MCSGVSVVDNNKLKDYVQSTVAERLRGMARERRERIALAAIGAHKLYDMHALADMRAYRHIYA